MQTKSTNRMRVFTDKEIDVINEVNMLTETETSNVSGGLIIFPIPSPCPNHFPWDNPFNRWY
jgi:hypothetical protein